MEATRGGVPRLASVLKDAGSALAVAEGRARLRGEGAGAIRAGAVRVGSEELDEWTEVLARMLERSPGTRFVPVTDPAYPALLAGLPDCPPFLFVRGDLPLDGSLPSAPVAVVGSRAASPQARETARAVSACLSQSGATVVSGLALGIDAEAHTACLDAGGRTIASLPCGVDRIYPEEHHELAERIASEGALVSRFWPDAPPRRDAFRLRNVVTSGISIATVVIDAGPTSGARMQARIALSQGRPVILMRDLVRREQWARRASERRGIVVAASPDEVVQAVSEAAPSLPAHQLSLF
jgi:DNA processing protein